MPDEADRGRAAADQRQVALGTGNVQAMGDGAQAQLNIYNGPVYQDARRDADASPHAAFRWPTAWDFAPFLEEKRLGFTGRRWLFGEIDAWLAAPAPRALLVRADFGVGKSAIVAEVVATRRDRVLAWHFCQHDTKETLRPGVFVASLAASLQASLPEYRALVEAEPRLQRLLDDVERDAASAFEGAIAAPLRRIQPPPGPRLLVIDALDEALELDDEDRRRHGTVVTLLAAKALRLPAWVRILVTARDRPEVESRLAAFAPRVVDAESRDNLADLEEFVLLRCEREPLLSRLQAARLTPAAAASVVVERSGGKFLYAVRALRDVESGRLAAADLSRLPPGMDAFYLDAFERRFERAGLEYGTARDVLGILAVAKEPVPPGTIAAILERRGSDVATVREVLSDFIRPVAGAWALDHHSVGEWLTGTSDAGFRRARGYAVDAERSRERFRLWALREVERGKAHETPYLVRHLAAHLADDAERQRVFGGLMLSSAEWLEARLLTSGIGVLVADCEHLDDGTPADLLRAVLRNGSHVLRNHPEQLPAQLIGRLLSVRELPEPLAALVDGVRRRGEERPAAAGSRRELLVPTTGSLRLRMALGAVLEGHTESVTAVAVLGDGRIVSGSHDSTVRVWDPRGREGPLVFEGHTNGVTALAVLRDGRIASGSIDGTVRVWDPTGRDAPIVLEGHTDSITDVAVLRDVRIVSGSCDRTVRLWGPTGRAGSVVLEGHSDRVSALAVMPDGRIGSASCDATIRVWDLSGRDAPLVLEGHRHWVTALAALADGRIASGSNDRTVRVWDPTGRRAARVLEGHTGWVTALAVLADGRLASGSNDGTVRVWDPKRSEAALVLDGHTSCVTAVAVLRDGRIASGSEDKTVRVWDPNGLDDPVVLEGHTGPITDLAVLAGGRIVSGADDETVCVWDPRGRRISLVREGRTDWVTAMAVTADGRIVSGSEDGTVAVWDPRRREDPLVLEGHLAAVTAIAVLPDGRIVSGAQDCTVRVWHPDGRGVPIVLKGHTDGVNSVAALPDGRFASASSDRTVRLWAPGRAAPIVLQGHAQNVNAVVVLRDGRIASGSNDETIRVWPLDRRDAPIVLVGHTDAVDALAVMTDGRIVSGSRDATVRVWDPRSRAAALVLEGNASAVSALAALAGGGFASGSLDRTVRVWDRRAAAVTPAFVADAPVTALAAAGRLLVVADYSGMVHFLEHR